MNGPKWALWCFSHLSFTFAGGSSSGDGEKQRTKPSQEGLVQPTASSQPSVSPIPPPDPPHVPAEPAPPPAGPEESVQAPVTIKEEPISPTFGPGSLWCMFVRVAGCRSSLFITVSSFFSSLPFSSPFWPLFHLKSSRLFRFKRGLKWHDVLGAFSFVHKFSILFTLMNVPLLNTRGHPWALTYSQGAHGIASQEELSHGKAYFSALALMLK